MDILRKMFKNSQEKKDGNDGSDAKDEFRKPQWFEEAETDDELFDDDRKFAFQIYTNPMELEKHFERQMQQLMEALNELEKGDVKVDKNLKEEYLKPGFEDSSILKEFEKHSKNFIDTDLDGEIYADELHSLMQRLNSGDEPSMHILPRNDDHNQRKLHIKKKLSDEETIMGKIHGTLVDEEPSRPTRSRPDIMPPMTPMVPRGVTPFGGVFEGTYQGPKMFSQSVMTKTIRKPDGSYETTRTTLDSQGNKTTTVTRSIGGKTETVTKYEGASGSDVTKPGSDQPQCIGPDVPVYSDRNIAVTKEGYAVPRNLW